jgi:hypothetical protein
MTSLKQNDAVVSWDIFRGDGKYRLTAQRYNVEENL